MLDVILPKIERRGREGRATFHRRSRVALRRRCQVTDGFEPEGASRVSKPVS
jgi:hypothetical protein